MGSLPSASARPKELLRHVYPGDPAYPVDEFRFGGTISLTVEVIYDGNGDHLAEDALIVVKRYLEERGCDLRHADHDMRTLPHRVRAEAQS